MCFFLMTKTYTAKKGFLTKLKEFSYCRTQTCDVLATKSRSTYRIQIADTVDRQKHVHTGNSQEIQYSGDDTSEFQWMENGRR